MQYRHRFKAHFTATIIGTLLASTCLQAWADNANKATPLALRKIMQDPGKNMQGVTDGISREDWEMVRRIAPLIAKLPQPPLTEKMPIMACMGADMGKFKGFDGQTHESANEMAMAAREKDGQKVISSFQKLQSPCLACPQAFRPAFVENFYGRSAN